jgi:hypothetical protein
MEKSTTDFMHEMQQQDRELDVARAQENAVRLGQGRHASVQRTPSQISISITTITTRSNALFVGRDAELDQLHKYLDPATRKGSSGAHCAVVHGLGGQGKSQLALAYYYRYRSSYHSAFWLNSETEHELRKSYADIGKKVRRASGSDAGSAPSSPEEEIGRDVDYAREWLEGTSK